MSTLEGREGSTGEGVKVSIGGGREGWTLQWGDGPSSALNCDHFVASHSKWSC
jgi:hypothetical protein